MENIPDWKELEQSGQFDSYAEMARHYTKLHVQAALQAASKKAKIIDDPTSYTGNTGSEYPAGQIVDENSILSAYPLENIK